MVFSTRHQERKGGIPLPCSHAYLARPHGHTAAGCRVMVEFRTGIGHDIHRLVPGKNLVLGGVTIPADVGFDTHSDGDVGLREGST